MCAFMKSENKNHENIFIGTNKKIYKLEIELISKKESSEKNANPPREKEYHLVEFVNIER